MRFLASLSKRERIAFGLGVVIALVAILDQLVARPVRGTISDLEQRIATRAIEGAAFRRKAARRPGLEAILREFAPFVRRTGSDEQETAVIQATIEALAAEAGISRIEYKSREAQDGKWFKTFKLEIECEAEVPQLMDLLYRLNTATDTLRVEQLTARPKGRQSRYVTAVFLVTRVARSQVTSTLATTWD